MGMQQSMNDGMDGMPPIQLDDMAPQSSQSTEQGMPPSFSPNMQETPVNYNTEWQNQLNLNQHVDGQGAWHQSPPRLEFDTNNKGQLSYTAQNVFTMVAGLGAVGMVAAAGGTFEAGKVREIQNRNQNLAQNRPSEAVLRAVAEMRKFEHAVDKMVPGYNEHRTHTIAQDMKITVASVALTAPVTISTLARSEKIDGRQSFQSYDVPGTLISANTLRVGYVYESRDDDMQWWPVHVESRNPDGSYRCHLVAKGYAFDELPVWPQVWANNCRIVAQFQMVPPHFQMMVATV